MQAKFVYILNYIKHAAELEKKQNEEDNKKLVGTVVTYGGIIQVCIF